MEANADKMLNNGSEVSSSKRVSFNDNPVVVLIPNHEPTRITLNSTCPGRSNQFSLHNKVTEPFRTVSSCEMRLRKNTSKTSLPLSGKVIGREAKNTFCVNKNVVLKSILKKPKKLSGFSNSIPTKREIDYFESGAPMTAPTSLTEGFDRHGGRTELDFPSSLDGWKAPFCNGRDTMYATYKNHHGDDLHNDRFNKSLYQDSLSSNLSQVRTTRKSLNHGNMGTITFSQPYSGLVDDQIEGNRFAKEINPGRGDLTVQRSPMLAVARQPIYIDSRNTLNDVSTYWNDAECNSKAPMSKHFSFSTDRNLMECLNKGVLNRSYTIINPIPNRISTPSTKNWANSSSGFDSIVTRTSSSSTTPYTSALYLKTGKTNHDRTFNESQIPKMAAEGQSTPVRRIIPYTPSNRLTTPTSFRNTNFSSAWLNEGLPGNSLNNYFNS